MFLCSFGVKGDRAEYLGCGGILHAVEAEQPLSDLHRLIKNLVLVGRSGDARKATITAQPGPDINMGSGNLLLGRK